MVLAARVDDPLHRLVGHASDRCVYLLRRTIGCTAVDQHRANGRYDQSEVGVQALVVVGGADLLADMRVDARCDRSEVDLDRRRCRGDAQQHDESRRAGNGESRLKAAQEESHPWGPGSASATEMTIRTVRCLVPRSTQRYLHSLSRCSLLPARSTHPMVRHFGGVPCSAAPAGPSRSAGRIPEDEFAVAFPDLRRDHSRLAVDRDPRTAELDPVAGLELDVRRSRYQIGPRCRSTVSLAVFTIRCRPGAMSL